MFGSKRLSKAVFWICAAAGVVALVAGKWTGAVFFTAVAAYTWLNKERRND